MNTHYIFAAVCAITMVAHICLIWSTGRIIGNLRRRIRSEEVAMDGFKQEHEKWKKDFEDTHPTWMTKKQRA